jgi:hypothetical protein
MQSMPALPAMGLGSIVSAIDRRVMAITATEAAARHLSPIIHTPEPPAT